MKDNIQIGMGFGGSGTESGCITYTMVCLSGEEKNTTSGGDNFEFHLELADSKNIVVVFILFFFPEVGVEYCNNGRPLVFKYQK